MWVTSKKYREKYGLTPQHLYALRKAGKVNSKKLFDRTLMIEDDDNNQVKKVAIYARVSTTKQENDLDNQVKFLREYAVRNGYNPELAFSDIASGMNENRKGLNELIGEVIKGAVSKVFVSHKDRLTRFGYGYLENLFNRFGTEIEVVNLEDDKSFQEELTEDLISIIRHFSMKFYGKRKNDCRKIEQLIKSSEE